MKLVLSILLVGSILSEARCDRQKRVALGREVQPHSKPYQVHNVFVMEDGDVQICGGALISPNYVLTAAHCFIELENIANTIVLLGAHNLKDKNKEYRISRQYIIHDGFKVNENYAINDIALIVLDEPVVLTQTIQTINLPTKSQINESFANETVSVAGWGKTETDNTSDTLREAISVIREDENICTHPKSLICTMQKSGAPCVGDSGSPLIFNNIVIGVLSTGHCIVFSHYTRITSFLDWIEENSDVVIQE